MTERVVPLLPPRPPPIPASTPDSSLRQTLCNSLTITGDSFLNQTIRPTCTPGLLSFYCLGKVPFLTEYLQLCRLCLETVSNCCPDERRLFRSSAPERGSKLPLSVFFFNRPPALRFSFSLLKGSRLFSQC